MRDINQLALLSLIYILNNNKLTPHFWNKLNFKLNITIILKISNQNST